MEMFTFADKDRDGKISYDEFLIMITPVKVSIRSISPLYQASDIEVLVLYWGNMDNKKILLKWRKVWQHA